MRSLLWKLLWQVKKFIPRGRPYPKLIVAWEDYLWGWKMPPDPKH